MFKLFEGGASFSYPILKSVGPGHWFPSNYRIVNPLLESIPGLQQLCVCLVIYIILYVQEWGAVEQILHVLILC